MVGLGNPGAAYKNTRHNAGYMLLDGIADGRFLDDVTIHRPRRKGLRRLFESKSQFGKTSGPYVSAEGTAGGKDFILIKPTTFMNESGKALLYLKRHGIVRNLSELLVVVDDVNLEFGRIRIREKGSAGGQNGLKSIISYLGTEDFARLRIGIGPKPEGEELKHYVLSSCKPEEKKLLESALLDASAVVMAWISEGFAGSQKVFSQLSR